MEQGRKGSDKFISMNSLWLKTSVNLFRAVIEASKVVVSPIIKDRFCARKYFRIISPFPQLYSYAVFIWNRFE